MKHELQLDYPILCLSARSVEVIVKESDLLTCSSRALTNGYFRKMLLVDSRGKAVRVKNAETARGEALNVWQRLVNARVRVRLHLDGKPFELGIDEVREHVQQALVHWHGWSTRMDFDQLQKELAGVRSFRNLITFLS